MLIICSSKGFCENVRKLVLGSNKFKSNIPFLCMISKEMMSNLYMLSPRVLHGILLYANGTCVVTFYENMIIR